MGIDYELLEEIARESGGPEDGSAMAPDMAQSGAAPAAPDAGGELPELEPAEGAEHGEAARDAPDAGGQLPALEPMPEAAAQTAAPPAPPDARAGLPDEVLALLGVSDAKAALEQIERIAVEQLTGQGVPEAAAREIVELRRRLGVLNGRARDESAPAGTDGVTQAVRPASAAPAGAGAGQSGAPDAPASPVMEHMARQIEYIRARTGVDMLEELRRAPELMAGVAAYSQGKGGMDIMGAYERVRVSRAAHRPRVPVTQTAGGGQLGGGHIDVSRLTDAQMDEIDRRVRAGEVIKF